LKYILALLTLLLPTLAQAQGWPAVNTDMVTAKAQVGISLSPLDYGAKCDGTTDDTAAFTTALAVSSVVIPPHKTCMVRDLVLNNRIIQGTNSVLRPAAGASWIVQLTGANSKLIGITLADTTSVLLRSSTLSATAAPAANSISVGSAAGFVVGNPIVITLDSGERHATIISSVAGTTIGLTDPIPFSATTASVNNGGAGCAANNSFVVTTGVGMPIVLSASTVDGSGTLNAAPVLQTHGQYTTTPTAVASAVTKGATNACTTLPTFDMTLSGAASGNAVVSGYPTVWINNASNYYVQDIRIAKSSFAIGLTGDSQNGTIRSLYAVASQIGFYNTGLQGASSFSDWKLYSDPSPNYWAWGIMVNGVVGAVYANAYSDIAVLGGDGGIICRRCKSHNFTSRTVIDTAHYYAMSLLGGDRNIVSGAELTFTTGATNDIVNGGKGVGLVIGNLETNLAVSGGLTTRQNAVDIYRESGTTWGINKEEWRTSNILGGSGGPIANSNCAGTGTATADGTRASGTVNLGATGTITQCSLSFSSGYTTGVVPICSIAGVNTPVGTVLDLTSATATGMAMRFTPGLTAGGKITWRCSK
jgi:hypothetical protein